MLKLKQVLIIIVLVKLLLGVELALAQGDSIQTPGNWSIGLGLHTGFLIAHRPSIVYLQKDHVKEVEITLLKSCKGDKEWHKLYNYPLYGIGYRYLYFGNDQQLGRGHSLYMQMQLPLTHSNRFRSTVRFGYGLGYVEKPFNTVDNYKNLAIGSKLNGTVLAGLQFRALASKKLQIQGGVDFFHFSNGAARIPNLGLNIPSINFGLSYFTGASSKTERLPYQPIKRNKELSIYTAIGFKEKYPPDGPTYLVNIFNAQYHFPIGQKALLGGGGDLIIDRSLPVRLEEDSIKTRFIEGAIRGGLFGSAGLRIGKWDGMFQTGIYLYNKVKEDGNLYSRLAVRYHINRNFFACFNLKTHFAKADYFEWGVGYIFRK